MMVGPVKNETPTKQDQQQYQPHRLQLLAQAIEKVESESSAKQTHPSTLPAGKNSSELNSTDSLSMASPQQQQELLMKLLAQQNMAAVMAAAAAAAQLQAHQQQKPEPISPPSTSSASSSVESPIDFSSHRSTDDNPECPSPPSPLPNQQQLLANMFSNLQSAGSSPSTSSYPFLLTSKNGKPTRPFKAYPRDPLMLPLGFGATGTSNNADQTNLLAEAMSRSLPNRKRFHQTQERLKQRLQQHQQQQTPPPAPSQSYFISSSGAQILQPPKKRHRTMTTDEHPLNDEQPPHSSTSSSAGSGTETIQNQDSANSIKDDAYWERRRKNNEAAKRSRDARRAKEDEIALRAAILEQENIKLRLEVSQLKQETAKLRCMVYTPS